MADEIKKRKEEEEKEFLVQANADLGEYMQELDTDNDGILVSLLTRSLLPKDRFTVATDSSNSLPVHRPSWNCIPSTKRRGKTAFASRTAQRRTGRPTAKKTLKRIRKMN